MKHEPEKDSLGDRMKDYENFGACGQRLMPFLPTILRLDGKCFHSFTKGLARPFDDGFARLMLETTIAMVGETCARIGYTQSDEITLVLEGETDKSQPYMGGRVFKIISVLAATCSAAFNQRLPEFLPSKVGQLPVFDCRAFNVPNRTEAVNCLIWREKDAVRNSISAVAQSLYSHNELFWKSCDEMQEMIFAKGQNWNDYLDRHKRGAYVRRSIVEGKLAAYEIDELPPLHHARQNPDMVVRRHRIEAINLPVMTKIVNREAVVFDGESPTVLP